MITIIDGWWGSGKSTLRGLLDGHPELFVSPIQDGIFGGFANSQNLQSILGFRDISEFRKVLCGAAEYNRIEKDSWSNSVFNAASGASWDNGRFTFDFYGFDRAYISKLMALEVWIPERLVEILYETMAEFWEDVDTNDRNFKGYVSMDNNLGMTAEYIVNHTSKVKYIWVDRPSEDIVAVHMKRRPVEGNLGTKGWGNQSVPGFIRSGYVSRHERRRNRILDLQSEHPDRILVIGLAELVEETKKSMQRVADFLNIESLPILNSYTYAGKPFPGSENYIGKLNDTAVTILNQKEIDMIHSEIRSQNCGKFSVRNNYRMVRRSLGAMIRSLSSDLQHH